MEEVEKLLKVLIVDDEVSQRTGLAGMVNAWGMAAETASEGGEALEKVASFSPDVIVTDLNMPGMDGMAMVKALRADARTRDVSILMLTSDGSVDSETLALTLGADDYLLKPVEPRRLAARIKSLLARSKTNQLHGSK